MTSGTSGHHCCELNLSNRLDYGRHDVNAAIHGAAADNLGDKKSSNCGAMIFESRAILHKSTTSGTIVSLLAVSEDTSDDNGSNLTAASSYRRDYNATDPERAEERADKHQG